jgi:hypothetical protein
MRPSHKDLIISKAAETISIEVSMQVLQDGDFRLCKPSLLQKDDVAGGT